MKHSFIIIAALTSFMACSKQSAKKPVPPTGLAGVKSNPTHNLATPDQKQQEKVTGIVMESEQKAGFNYIQLKTEKRNEWFAILDGSIKTGDRVTVAKDTVMENFKSKVLHRTFDRLTFGSIVDRNKNSQ